MTRARLLAAVVMFALVAPAWADQPTTAPAKTCRVVLNAKYEGLDKPPAGVARLVGKLLAAAGYRAVGEEPAKPDATLMLELAGELKSRSYDEYEDTGEDHLFVNVSLTGRIAWQAGPRSATEKLSGSCLVHQQTEDEQGLTARAYESALEDAGLPGKLANMVPPHEPGRIVFLANVLLLGNDRLAVSAVAELKKAEDLASARSELIAAFGKADMAAGNIAELLIRIGDEKVVDCLLEAARIGAGRRREAAIAALAKFPQPRVIDFLVCALMRDRNSYELEHALMAMGQPAAPRLIEELKKPEHQAAAASMLGQMKAKSSVKPLLALLSSDNKDVRWQAVRALGEIGDSDAIGPVLKLARTDKDVRPAALLALGKLKAKDAAPLLIASLKDTDPRVRQFAVWGLEEYSGQKLGDKQGPWEAWWRKEQVKDLPGPVH